jgi:hypothetical protein
MAWIGAVRWGDAGHGEAGRGRDTRIVGSGEFDSPRAGRGWAMRGTAMPGVAWQGEGFPRIGNQHHALAGDAMRLSEYDINEASPC